MTTYANQWGPEGVEYPGGLHAVLTFVKILRKVDLQIATLYKDKEKTVPQSNPVRTDSLGNLSFFVDPGDYYLELNGARIPISVPLHPSELLAGGGEIGDFIGGFSYPQNVPTDTWVIPHPLKFLPAAVVAIDSSGTVVHGGVSYPDPHTVILSFSVPFSGVAWLS